MILQCVILQMCYCFTGMQLYFCQLAVNILSSFNSCRFLHHDSSFSYDFEYYTVELCACFHKFHNSSVCLINLASAITLYAVSRAHMGVMIVITVLQFCEVQCCIDRRLKSMYQQMSCCSWEKLTGKLSSSSIER